VSNFKTLSKLLDPDKAPVDGGLDEGGENNLIDPTDSDPNDFLS
jgi:hypothetical protein